MDKEQLENNLKEIIELYNNLKNSLFDLQKWIKNDCEERKILDELLDKLWLEKNEKSRFAAYSRIVNLQEESLILYLDKQWLSDDEKLRLIDSSYDFVCDFHSEIQAVIISVIESKELLTPFYLEIFKWTANVWLAFNELFLPWRNHIVNGINAELENRFENDSNKIMDFLNENNLFDKGHNWELADRSYSALVLEADTYVSKSYSEVFPDEIKSIVEELDSFINNLSKLDDEIYDAKQNYIDYLKAIKTALVEKKTDKLVEKWSKVDEAWMSITTPFQISHPLEFYEDKYRKAVAPEWDLRIQNKVFESNVENSILSMYESFYDDIGRDNFRQSYMFSLDNQKRVQLYLSSPVLYYSSELTWLFSAQVVPNDEIISEAHGKKIFAFPEMVLESNRSTPFMKICSVIFDENLLSDYRKNLFSNSEAFYKIYDISTIWHEYGHTLWLDTDTEILMNKKSWSYKNIEEFKATTGWLVMFFMHEELASNMKKELLIEHIYRSVNLLKYRKVDKIEPYYCEALIHLSILFESWIILINDNNKIELNYSEANFIKLKKTYIEHYRKLINIYLSKVDAWLFLNDYAIKTDWYYLPINDEIKIFVEHYYSTYLNIGNEIDESVTKENYTQEKELI